MFENVSAFKQAPEESRSESTHTENDTNVATDAQENKENESNVNSTKKLKRPKSAKGARTPPTLPPRPRSAQPPRTSEPTTSDRRRPKSAHERSKSASSSPAPFKRLSTPTPPKGAPPPSRRPTSAYKRVKHTQGSWDNFSQFLWREVNDDADNVYGAETSNDRPEPMGEEQPQPTTTATTSQQQLQQDEVDAVLQARHDDVTKEAHKDETAAEVEEEVEEVCEEGSDASQHEEKVVRAQTYPLFA